MRELEGGRVGWNAQMYKPLRQNIRARCLVWYYNPRVIPGTSHKLRPYQVTKLIVPSLADINPLYYPGEDRLVSLDELKLYHGENVVQQNPEDIFRLITG